MTLLFALLAASQAGASPAPSATGSVPADAAVIVNSGSTNTMPWRIVVRPDRSVAVSVGSAAPSTKQLTAATTATFFKDLGATGSFSSLHAEPCMKSASFGTTTHITYKGSTSPDLSCTFSDVAGKLSKDVAAIRQEVGIDDSAGSLFRRFHGQPIPAATASPLTN
jgi:hypothetical protein